MYAYKKLTAQDIAVIPFNAHKQYNFDSASCSSNKIDHYNTQWTSESISLYTSTSAVYGGDTKNVLKYQQLDHLFYREFPANHSNTLGSFHYLKQKRNLYERVNILSIPTGLYGYEIKPGSFYLKTTDGSEVVDDLYGNLIISGTYTSSDYPTDVRENIFRLDPIKGFKDYDLGVYKDYALKFAHPQHPEAGIKKVFYKRGDKIANPPTTYSTPDDIFETDDSYFHNSFKYNRINFLPLPESEIIQAPDLFSTTGWSTNNPGAPSVGSGTHTFQNNGSFSGLGTNYNPLKHGIVYEVKITVDSIDSGIKIKYNDGVSYPILASEVGTTTTRFTADTTITNQFVLYSTPTSPTNPTVISNVSLKEIKTNPIPSLTFNSITGSNIVSEHNERYNFNRDDDFAISFYMEPSTIVNAPTWNNALSVGDQYQGGYVFHIDAGNYAYVVHPVINSGFNAFWGPNNMSTGSGTGGVNPIISTEIGDGKVYTDNMVDAQAGATGFLGDYVQNLTIDGYNDWWLPTVLEYTTIDNALDIGDHPGFTHIPPGYDWQSSQWFGSTIPLGGASANLVTSEDNTIGTRYLTRGLYNPPPYTNVFLPPNTPGKNKDCLAGAASGPTYCNTWAGSITFPTGTTKFFFPVRRADLNTFDSSRRYIIAKSTTRSTIPTSMEGRSETLNMNASGGLANNSTGSNMQPLDTPSQPQFPYEIYMTSQSLHFARSDGDHTVSISCEVTGSLGSVEKLTHILCQNSASNMELYFDGVLKVSSSVTSSLKPQTQNRANLYIGSKGEESQNDGNGSNSIFKYYMGNLSCINIWEEAYNQTEVKNISESLNSSPHIGNIFYKNGFATITHPKYHSILSGSTGNGTISQLKFQGTYQMYEHEYQCTVDEHEFNQTLNISTREIKSNNNYNLAGFTTSSYFKPYVTTIGLYNEEGDCLVVGKLGQPIKMSNETDTTFIIRWDT